MGFASSSLSHLIYSCSSLSSTLEFPQQVLAPVVHPDSVLLHSVHLLSEFQAPLPCLVDFYSLLQHLPLLSLLQSPILIHSVPCCFRSYESELLGLLPTLVRHNRRLEPCNAWKILKHTTHWTILQQQEKTKQMGCFRGDLITHPLRT